jgi:glycosyltransferase involved in cell wall biosynthesis
VAARRAGIPNIVTIRNVYPNKPFNINYFVDQLLVKNANFVVFNSRCGRDIFTRRVRSHNVVAIHNGLFLDTFRTNHQDPGKTRRQFNLPPDKRLLTTVAKLSLTKGHDVLIDAMPEILSRHPECHFAFVGDEYKNTQVKARLQQHAVERGVANAITWIDFTDNVAQLLHASTVSILPSTSGEGLPRVIIESMASGVPPVATDIPGISEMIMHGRNGFLCKPGDPHSLAEAVFSALELTPKEYDRFCAENRELAAERFDIPVMMKKYRDLYFSLVSRGSEATAGS